MLNGRLTFKNRSRRFLTRRASGNTLILVLAVTLLLGLFFLFALNYIRSLGNNLEQTTAIEAAALAAAHDLSSIVIEDQYFGFVGLSDSPPTGKGTTAGDNYFMPVTGINTLFATIRLDLIIADALNDPLMKQRATDDYNRALTARDRLLSALNGAVAPGGTGGDMNGKTVNLTTDAAAAYQLNLIRMSGPSRLVPGSMKLSLGYVDGLNTNTVLPQPLSSAQLAANQQKNGFYKPNTVASYGGLPFVFAAVNDDVALVDFKMFKPTLTGLPFSIPTIIKCEADQQYSERNERGDFVKRTVHAVAAAEASSPRDARPTPGAFTISFPNGMIPEITRPADLITDQQITMTPCDSLQTPPNGDAPGSPLTDLAMPELSSVDKNHPLFGNLISISLYDWIRRGGTHLNVAAVVNMLETDFKGDGSPQIHEFEAAPDGSITYSIVPAASVNLPVSQKQWRAISGIAYRSINKNMYDMQLTDYVYQPAESMAESMEASHLTAKS